MAIQALMPVTIAKAAGSATLPCVTFLDSIILGIVEGITEFLPVSSTGHLILTANALGLQHTEFLKSFEIAIQLGAVFAVLALFPRRFLEIETLKKLIVGFIPTAVIGLIAYDVVKGVLLGNELVVVTALAVGGIIMIAFEYFRGPHAGTSDVSYRHAALIGVFQSIAMIPGVSRSGAAIIGGLALGLSRTAIVEFSFLLAVPTMLAATSLDLLKTHRMFEGGEWALLATGFITSFVVALIAMRGLLAYVKDSSFIAFGVYRIVLALVYFVVFIA